MIKLLLKSKKKKTKTGAQFRTYFTDVMIVVKGEESKGKQRKTVNVRFGEDVDTKPLVRGFLTVNEADIDLPFKYQIITKDDGKESYPTIFIRKYEKYEEKKGESTIEFITDESETAETVIDEAEEEVEESEIEDKEEVEDVKESTKVYKKKEIDETDDDLPF